MKVVDIEVAILIETDKAVLITDDGDTENAVWIPKSQIEIERTKDHFAIVTMEEWLAIDKGFV